MRLLITGATGFIGRNLLLRAIAAKSWREVIAPVRNPEKLLSILVTEGWEKPPPTLRILRWTPGLWGENLECDAAVHCAGVLFGRTEAEYRANVQGPLELLRALPVSAKVILLSSQSAGGPTPWGREARDEEIPDEPITLYGKSKREMEAACLSAFPDRDILFLRLPMVLGARDRAILPLFRLSAGMLRPKPGIVTKYYSFLSVKDLCGAIFAVLGCDTVSLQRRIYYVCHPKSVSDRDLIECVAGLLGKKGWIFPVPHSCVRAASHFVDAVPFLRNVVPSLTRDRVHEIFFNRWVIEGGRFEETFCFYCATGFVDSLSDTLWWYRKLGIF